jgi:hypothetical protein
MEIERTVRAACTLREPAPDFEDVVMARVSAAAWRAARGPRVRRRIFAISALLAGSVAASMLVMRYHGSGVESPPPVLQVATMSAPQVMEETVPTRAAVPPAGSPVTEAIPPLPPPSLPTATEVSQVCAAAQAGPSAAPAYTVLMEPLQFETEDPDLASRAQRFYAGVINQLKSIPGLALVGTEAAGTAGKPADYRVSVSIVKAVNTNAGLPAWQSIMSLQQWTGTSFAGGRSIGSAIPALDSSICPSTPAGQVFNCRLEPAAAGIMLNLSATLPRHPTPAQASCQNTQQQFFRNQIAQQRTADPASLFPPVRQTLERLATTTNPITRSNAWGSLGRNAHPEYAQLLVQALRESSEDAFRREVVTLLVLKYPDDPAAREALAAIAARSRDTLMSHVAERPTAAPEVWRDYAVSRLSDDRLPTEQRLDALYWMAEAITLDKDRIAAEMSALLAVLQRDGRLLALANILAGTLKDLGEAGLDPAGQRGQWMVRQLGSVHHPAAPELLMACFDAAPNYLTLGALATRLDDPRVANKLQDIASQTADERLRRIATSYLNDPQNAQPPASAAN